MNKLDNILAYIVGKLYFKVICKFKAHFLITQYFCL